MISVPDTIKIISKTIKQTFDELIKLLLWKSIKPSLNGIRNTNKVVYNSCRNRIERGLTRYSDHKIIGKYLFVVTPESLGWNDDTFMSIKVCPKACQNFDYIGKNNLFTKKKNVTNRYPDLINYLISGADKQNHHNLKKVFTGDITYSETFKKLESIGNDIIEQTDPSISSEECAKMSTANLRVKLFILDQTLGELSIKMKDIYDSYLEMIRLINAVPKQKLSFLLNFLITLTYQPWENLELSKKQNFVDILTSDYINALINNQLITILLQNDLVEEIIHGSYLYPLLKMLFVVFGYSKITPIVEHPHSLHQPSILNSHYERYRGGSLRRPDCISTNTNNTTPATKVHPYHPVEPEIYEYIQMFADLYPSLVGIMGGTEIFPPENMVINCHHIPRGYHELGSISGYLLRFNDYSYCRHIQLQNNNQIAKDLNTKVSDRIKILCHI